LQIEVSQALHAKLTRADAAIKEYEAQQQIIWILLERLGGSVTIGLESLVTKRLGTIQVHRDEDTGATTISLKKDEAVAA
jgi:hypothetical protein